jgi:hypothetical protein
VRALQMQGRRAVLRVTIMTACLTEVPSALVGGG